ncbi:MAG TPA: regulatory signaling modulator protein AmpE [Pseudomonadales bacterium]|nr:regulatory signaling modulator protein AmpE [Pseudomonadales bacterium]
MSFISVVIVFVILQVWGTVRPVQQDGWLGQVREASKAVLGHEKQSYGVVVFPPLILGVLVLLIGDWLFGLVGLLIYVLVLMYSLGRGDLTAELNRYLDAWQRGDKQADTYMAAEWIGDLPDDLDETRLHQLLRKRFLYRSLERWFAVLFWFVIFGPSGALLYRLCRLEFDRGMDVMRPWIHVMEWLPVRILGLVFGLVGDFSNTIDAWRKDVLEIDVASDALCDDYAVAALRLDTSGLSDGDLDSRSRAIIEWSDVQNLVHRAVVVWLVAIAILQII